MSAALQRDVPGVSAACLQGTQHVTKSSQGEWHDIFIWLGAIRLPRVRSDILVTWNDSSGAITEAQFTQLLRSIEVVDWGLFVAGGATVG